jgi:transcriptional regulator with XRE-family HTH domain
VALGSYERGDRSLSVSKAIELSEFYEVPLSYLLTGLSPTQSVEKEIVIDLRRIKALSIVEEKTTPTQQILSSFLLGIIKERQDFNGEILSLRKSDIEFLTITIGCTSVEFAMYLGQNKLLFETKETSSL